MARGRERTATHRGRAAGPARLRRPARHPRHAVGIRRAAHRLPSRAARHRGTGPDLPGPGRGPAGDRRGARPARGGGAGSRPGRRPGGVRPRPRGLPARRHRDGQDRRGRAQLHLRCRRHLRRRARRGGRRGPGPRGRDRSGDRPDEGVFRHDRGGLAVACRRGAAPGGQGRSAGADGRLSCRLLPSVGQDLGVPGPAQGLGVGRGPCGRDCVQVRPEPDGLGGRRAGALRRGRPGHAAPGREARPARRGGPAAQAWARRAARRGVRRPAAPARPRPV